MCKDWSVFHTGYQYIMDILHFIDAKYLVNSFIRETHQRLVFLYIAFLPQYIHIMLNRATVIFSVHLT